jgi:membrane protease YdiL (CAAX protease family)
MADEFQNENRRLRSEGDGTTTAISRIDHGATNRHGLLECPQEKCRPHRSSAEIARAGQLFNGLTQVFVVNAARCSHPWQIRYNPNQIEPALTPDFDSERQEFASDRGSFLNLAGLVQGGMILAAIGLAWLFELDLWLWMRWDGGTWLWSFLGVTPLIAMFLIMNRWPVGPLRKIKSLLLGVIGPSLAACRWYDLLLLAALAGLGEEWLFRGVIQLGLAAWLGPWAGLVVAAMLFGLLHAVTPAYAVLAGLIGLYLGGLMVWWDPPNLTVPIVIHAVYDWVAFVVLRAEYRRRATS